MAKTWRRIPLGSPKEPRPLEKGGKHNIIRELDEFSDDPYEDDPYEDDPFTEEEALR